MTIASTPPRRAGRGRSWLLFGLFALLVLAILAALVPDWPMIQRLRTMPTKRPWPIAWFEPKETVKGAPGAPLPAVAPGEGTIPAASLDNAVEYAKSMNTQALLVWRAGKLERAWYAEGVTPDTVLNPYYMNFSALILLVGIAQAEGKIPSLDTPAATWLTEWKNDDRAKITVKDLLQMASGLKMYHDSTSYWSDATKSFFGSHSEAASLAYPAEKSPQTMFQYNYIVPEVLGVMLERATGRRYADYLSEKLWKPLGNQDGYLWLDREGGKPHYNAALFSNADDWLRVGVMIEQKGLFDGKQVVPADFIAQMMTPSKMNPNFGFMWLGTPYVAARKLAPDVAYTVLSSAPFAATDLAMIDGYGGQRVYVVPSQQLVIVRIGETRKDFDDSAIPNRILTGLGLTPAGAPQ